MPFQNILIVNPQTPRSYWSFEEAIRFLGPSYKTAHSSNALFLLAALISERFLVRLIDMNAKALSNDDIKWADAVLITGWNIHRESIKDLIRRCNAYGKPSVVGGAFATVSPNAPELTHASSIFVGEAIDRNTFERLMHELAAGKLQKRYVAAARPPMSQSPVPRYDLLDLSACADLTMLISCGCPFQCKFCTQWRVAGPPRYKSGEQALIELQTILDTGFRGSVFIADDNIIGDERQAWEIFQAIRDWQKRHGFPFSFYVQADLRLANKEQLARLMANAGVRCAFIGIESSSEAQLRQMGKKQNIGVDVAEAFTRLRGWGIDPQCGLILGNDEDTVASFAEMIAFVRRIGAPRAMVGMCVAMDGTVLLDQVREEGRLLFDEGTDQFDIPNIRPKHMSLAELVTGHREVLGAIYAPAAYFERSLRNIKELKPVHRFHVGWREIRAAFRSLALQGVFGSYRREYWKFLLKVLVHDPRKMGMAFAAAIVFAHFYAYTKELREGLPAVLDRVKKIENENSASVAMAAE